MELGWHGIKGSLMLCACKKKQGQFVDAEPPWGYEQEDPPWQGKPLSCGLLQPGRFGDVTRCWPEGHRLPKVCTSPGCW